ncbi:MAG: TonB family protein [Kiritimatiellia bacterium]
MQSFNQKVFKWVAGTHAAIFLVLLSYGTIAGCFRPKPDRVIPIDFVVDVRQPAPDVAPESPAPSPEPRRDPAPIPPPEPRPPRQIQVNTNRMVRQPTAAPQQPVATAPNPLTAEEIQRLLNAGARAGTVTQIPADDDARGLATIRNTLYAIWQTPSRAAVGDAEAVLELHLGPGGAVQSTRLIRPSGNPVLDESVTQVGRQIRHIHGLPAGFVQRRSRVTIAFSVE